MVCSMLSGESIPSQLGLYNLGFEAPEGEAILEKIMENGFSGLTELRLDRNHEFWTDDSGCLELLTRVLSVQTEISKLFLCCRETAQPYTMLRREQDSLPEPVQLQL